MIQHMSIYGSNNLSSKSSKTSPTEMTTMPFIDLMVSPGGDLNKFIH